MFLKSCELEGINRVEDDNGAVQEGAFMHQPRLKMVNVVAQLKPFLPLILNVRT